MPADTSVKFLHSLMPGAPVLSGTAGSLIAVLDACLVNGFAVSAVASLVVSANVATATIAAGHSAEVGSVVTVSGAAPGGLNGEKKVLSVNVAKTTLTYDATGIGDQAATGAISLKLAGAGWSKPFSGANLAAYRSLNVAATGCYLRVDDTGARVARCVGYESMTGISAGAGPFPSAVQRSGGVYWPKSNVADATSRRWSVFADDRMAYLILGAHASVGAAGALVAFGDILPKKAGDAWACVLSGHASDTSAGSSGDLNDYATQRNSLATADELYLARAFYGSGGSMPALAMFNALTNAGQAMASGGGAVPFPNGPDGGLYVGPHNILEFGVPNLRGESAGLYCSPQAIADTWISEPTPIDGVANLPGRRVMAHPYGGGTGATYFGFVFFDVTGPWRA
jgi:hypothetical protein